MIKAPLSGKLESLKDFKHDLFIDKNGVRELHVWEHDKLIDVLVRLEAGGALPDSVTNKGDFYIVTF